jgi:acyl-CoA synthetase (AMP-forming)/AMP-acid ligase II
LKNYCTLLLYSQVLAKGKAPSVFIPVLSCMSTNYLFISSINNRSIVRSVSCYVGPVLVVMPWLSCFGCLVLAVMSWSCFRCVVIAVLFWLSCHCCLFFVFSVMVVLFGYFVMVTIAEGLTSSLGIIA